MKKFLMILSSIFVFGCSSYSQQNKIIYDCTIKDSITQEEKSINIDNYKKELSERGGYKIIDNEEVEAEISLNNGLFKTVHDKKTNIVKFIDYDLTSKKVLSNLFYYKKGGFKIGKEYHYDSSGNIIKIINNDDPENYTLCYKEAEAIVMKRVGKKYEIENIARREETIKNQKVYLWSVIATIKGSRKYSDSKNFWIDSKTGKIIKVLKLYHFD